MSILDPSVRSFLPTPDSMSRGSDTWNPDDITAPMVPSSHLLVSRKNSTGPPERPATSEWTADSSSQPTSAPYRMVKWNGFMASCVRETSVLTRGMLRSL